MSTSNNTLKWMVIALIAMNLVLLAFLFFLRPQHPGPPKPGQRGNFEERSILFLEKELNLSDEQVTTFKALRKEHFQTTRKHFGQLREMRREMFQSLSSEPADSLKADSIAQQIGTQQSIIEKGMIDHYLKLQAECTPEQRTKLERVFHKAMQRPKGPRRRGFKK